MFSRLFKTPKSSLQLFRKNQAAMLPNDAESPQFPSENFSSLPIIWKVGLTRRAPARRRLSSALCVGNGKSKSGMQMPGSIAAANLPCDDHPSDAAFGHVVFGRNATILRPLKDPPGMPTEDVLTLLESRILGLSVDHLQHLVLNPFCLIVIIAVLQSSPPQLHGFAQQTHERRNELLIFCVLRGVHTR